MDRGRPPVEIPEGKLRAPYFRDKTTSVPERSKATPVAPRHDRVVSCLDMNYVVPGRRGLRKSRGHDRNLEPRLSRQNGVKRLHELTSVSLHSIFS